jgi:biotin synthase
LNVSAISATPASKTSNTGTLRRAWGPMLDQPAIAKTTRHDWSVEEIVAIHDQPLLELIAEAAQVHARHHRPSDVQRASLLSIKTGACPEDCAYCPQSAHHKEVKLDRVDLMATDEVLALAARAKNAGADRFCMGAAWRNVRDGREFDAVLDMVSGVRALGMEACVTLGMLTPNQADRLKQAGLTAYNHNLDTGPDFYADIISTRTYADRLKTLHAVRDAGLQMCAGGIIGMGESIRDRADMLRVLAGFDPHPESVPINALVPVAGTPLAGRPPLDPLDLVRMIATARIVMPLARVRLSAGRSSLSREAQVLCMAAGANSIFYGETLLTTPNAEVGEDDALFAALAARDPAVVPAVA